MKALVVLLAFTACAAPDSAPTIDKIRPPWGPMTGGTSVEILGRHFDPYVNRVFVGGREAAVTKTIDDQHLDIVIPPSDRPGDVEVVVVTPDDNTTAAELFRYSAPPEIESVTPARVLLSGPPVMVTLRGNGFIDEDAGTPLVIVDGQPIADVDVRDDSTLRFQAPSGVAFTRADIQVVNQRGSVSAPGYRYAVSDHPGLLVFGLNSGTFVTFYDPTNDNTVFVPEVPANNLCLYGVIGDGEGTYWGSDYCALGEWGFGRIDLAKQQLVDTVVTGRLYPSMTRHRGVRYAIEYSSNRFGTLSTAGDAFAPIGTMTFSCCDFGLASDDTTMWLVSREVNVPTIRTVDPETGTLGASVPLTPNTSVSDLRWFDGVLYATTTSGYLVTIDPGTGVVTTLFYVGNSYGLEVFD